MEEITRSIAGVTNGMVVAGSIDNEHARRNNSVA